MDFNGILAGIKRFISPPIPPAQPLERGQTVSSFPGYQAEQSRGGFQAPPQSVDMNTLGNLLGGAANKVGDFFGGLFPSKTYHFDYRSPAPQATGAPASTPTPTIAPMATATPAPSAPPSDLEGVIRKAMAAYGNPPVATLSAELAQAGEGLPDPLLPAVVSLKESSGGKKLTYPNNFVNILQPGKFDYPTPQSNITGEHGDDRWSFKELLNEGSAYGKYRKSGDLADFFQSYTPPGGSNASLEDQIAMYNLLKEKYFSPYQ